MAPSLRDSYRDKMSQMIAEYLLKGYTMLNAYCPECNVSGKSEICHQSSQTNSNRFRFFFSSLR